MSSELALKMKRFQPRSYQEEIIWQIEENNCKKALLIYPRRCGKDIVAFNIAVRRCLKSTCTIFYIFPTYSSAKRIIWDAIDNDGHRILSWYCPDELVHRKNSSEMMIEFKNGSVLRLVGSNSYNNLMGINFQGAIFSEYALQDPNAYVYLAPVPAANNGFVLLISTPRGHTHMYELYERARHSKDWFVSKLTVDDTKHIPIEEINVLRDTGVMSEDKIQQEFYCSFDLGIEGSYYCKLIDKMNVNGQLCTVPYDPSFKVFTSWDLGVKDMTTIIWGQVVSGNVIRIIDYYENTGKGLDHYAHIVLNKEYVYSKHIGPFDLAVREWGAGATKRIDKARQLGIQFTTAPKLPIADGIECVKTILPKCWIDENKCKRLIQALENYHREFNEDKRQYADHQYHDWSSNAADAMRYLAISLKLLSPGLTAEDLDKRYADAMMGGSKMPRPFHDGAW